MSVYITTPVWKNSQASTKSSLLLLLTIADQADDDGFTWGNQTKFQDRARVKSDRTVSASIADLVRAGELIVYRRPNRTSAYFVRVEGCPMLDEYEQWEKLKELDPNAEWWLYVPSEDGTEDTNAPDPQKLRADVVSESPQNLRAAPAEIAGGTRKNCGLPPQKMQGPYKEVTSDSHLFTSDSLPLAISGNKEVGKSGRPRDPIWDALEEVFGYRPATKNEQSLWGKIRKLIKETSEAEGLDPVQALAERVLIWEFHYDVPITPATLLNKWQWLGGNMARPDPSRRQAVRKSVESRSKDSEFWSAVAASELEGRQIEE